MHPENDTRAGERAGRNVCEKQLRIWVCLVRGKVCWEVTS